MQVFYSLHSCWVNQSFVILQLEDLGKVESMTEKRFSSFMKVGSTMLIQMKNFLPRGLFTRFKT